MAEQGHQHTFITNKHWPIRVDYCHYEVWKQKCGDKECDEVIELKQVRPDSGLLMFGNPRECKECEKRMRANPQLHDLLKNNGLEL